MLKRILGLLSLGCALMGGVLVAAGVPSAGVPSAGAEAGPQCVYRLDFSDAAALGKNTAAGGYAEATVHTSGEGGLTQTAGPRGGTYAVQFPEQTASFANYLELPTSMFEGAEAATVAGWFRVPANIESWTCEFSVSANGNVLRADPYATNSWDGYLLCFGKTNTVGEGQKDVLRPVFDTWQHLAYVISGHTLSVYQNGTKVKEMTDATMSASLLHGADAKFYLGQNTYEGGHKDYNGAVSDFRVYRSALTEAQIAGEYSLNYKDFLSTEYTFDGAESLYTENVRGYNGTAFASTFVNPTSQPAYVADGDGGYMHLDGKSAFLLSKNENGQHNGKLLMGHAELTVSMDLRISSAEATNTGWERIFDIIIDVPDDAEKAGYVSAMAHAEPNSPTEFLYGNRDGGAGTQKWLFRDVTHVSKMLPVDEWINLTYSIGLDNTTVYLNGVPLASANLQAEHPLAESYKYLLTANSYFLLGSPAHEKQRFLAADYDNVRVYATALDGKDVMEVVTGSEHVDSSAVTVTFDGREETYMSGNAYALPEPTPRKGWTFEGWYEEKAPATLLRDTFTAAEGQKFLSKWTLRTYTIGYKLPDGATNPNEVTEYTVQSEGIEFLPAEYNGLKFEGWYLEGTDTKVTEIPAGELIGEGDVVLEARFESAYLVFFEANGGLGEMAPFNLPFGGQANLPHVTFRRTGYRFDGWAKSADGAKQYADGGAFGAPAEGEGERLYALWVAAGYTVHFDANGGEGSVRDAACTYGEAFALPQNAFTREGYEFAGWSLTKNGIALGDAGEDAVSLASTDGALVTLYARWVRKTFTVTVKGLGADIVCECAYGEGVRLSELLPAEKKDVRLVGADEREYGADDVVFVRENLVFTVKT